MTDDLHEFLRERREESADLIGRVSRLRSALAQSLGLLQYAAHTASKLEDGSSRVHVGETWKKVMAEAEAVLGEGIFGTSKKGG
jgi:hypothetical protein